MELLTAFVPGVIAGVIVTILAGRITVRSESKTRPEPPNAWPKPLFTRAALPDPPQSGSGVPHLPFAPDRRLLVNLREGDKNR